MSTLKEKLDDHKKHFLAKVTDEIVTVVKAAGGELAATVPTRKTPKVGDRFPSFSMVGSGGSNVTSESLLSNGPLVVTFFRGMW